jgi:23S rRNA pseudouridine1911/1915/1917 synthase
MNNGEEEHLGLCPLGQWDSLADFLGEALKLSRAKIKKAELSRSWLKSAPQRELQLPITLVNHGMIDPRYTGLPLSILFEDDDLLVLDKLPGLHCHPLSYGEGDNVLSFLRSSKITAPLAVNQDLMDRGLLYRLDFGTSGVLALAKNQQIYDCARELAIAKDYLCLVRGPLPKLGELHHLLAPRDERGAKMGEHSQGTPANLLLMGQKAIGVENIHLVWVRLKTGLRHQIRAQLSLIGHPIIGDELYGGEKSSRIFLHAKRYILQKNEKRWVLHSKMQNAFAPYLESFNGIFLDLDGDL